MSSLVHAALTIRRTARESFGFVAAGALVALDLLGVFRRELGPEHAFVAAAFGAIAAVRAFARWRVEEQVRDEREAALREVLMLDLEIGLLVLGGVHAAVQAFGGLGGPLYPLVYVVVAFFAVFA